MMKLIWLMVPFWGMMGCEEKDSYCDDALENAFDISVDTSDGIVTFSWDGGEIGWLRVSSGTSDVNELIIDCPLTANAMDSVGGPMLPCLPSPFEYGAIMDGVETYTTEVLVAGTTYEVWGGRDSKNSRCYTEEVSSTTEFTAP